MLGLNIILKSYFFTKIKLMKYLGERLDCGDLYQSGSGEMVRTFKFWIYFEGKSKDFLMH